MGFLQRRPPAVTAVHPVLEHQSVPTALLRHGPCKYTGANGVWGECACWGAGGRGRGACRGLLGGAVGWNTAQPQCGAEVLPA